MRFHGFDLQASPRLARRSRTFVEIQLLVLLLLLLLLAVVFARVVVVVLGNPLDLPARLLPLAALVQRRLWRFFDEVIRLCLSQDGSLFALKEQLDDKQNMNISSLRSGVEGSAGHRFKQQRLHLIFLIAKADIKGT